VQSFVVLRDTFGMLNAFNMFSEPPERVLILFPEILWEHVKFACNCAHLKCGKSYTATQTGDAIMIPPDVPLISVNISYGTIMKTPADQIHRRV